MTTSRQKRIDEYSSKIIELQKKIKAEKAKVNETTRRERTRRLIQIGGFIESAFSAAAIDVLKHLSQEQLAQVENWLIKQTQSKHNLIQTNQ